MTKVWFLVKLLGKRSSHILFFTVFLFTSSSLFSFEYQRDLTTQSDFYEHKRALRYFDSVDENTSVEEMVDFLLSLKASLVAKGYHLETLLNFQFILEKSSLTKGLNLMKASLKRYIT
ncbi:MAG: hypothetical protein HKM07_02470 [Chlamydiae bacterium]|nr:hypothetical protein [Chlamydiota bacterium]